MKKKWLVFQWIVILAALGFVPCYGQTTSPQTALPLSASPVQAADSQTLKALEVALIRLKAAEERNELLGDRLKAKDAIIEAKDGLIAVRDEQLKLALEANKDRATVNTGDARMLERCDAQLARADLEIARLRSPGLLRSIFDFRTMSGALVGFGVGRLTK